MSTTRSHPEPHRADKHPASIAASGSPRGGTRADARASVRRAMRTATCLLLIVAALIVVPDRHQVSAQPPEVLFGSSAAQRGSESPRQAVERIEGQIGRSLAVVRVFRRWDSAFPTDYDLWLRNSGHTLFLSVAAQRLSGKLIPWSFIASAQPSWKIYQDMVRWADRIKAFGATVYFLFDPEPETSNGNVMGQPSDFVDAWRKIVSVFQDDGVTNVRWVWDLTAYTFGRTDALNADAWYPGDAYVDGIGADGYNFYACRSGVSNVWRSFAQVFESAREFGLAHPSEFLTIPEWGTVEDPQVPGRKAQWIADAQATLQSPGWDQFKAILYWNSQSPTTPPCEFQVDTSQSALDAFQTMGADPYFSGVGPPTVASFSPERGLVGTAVTIAGANFQAVQSVTFGGVAASFTVTNQNQIVATVPAGAAAGPIQVTTQAGSAASSARFGVIHPREISLTLGKRVVVSGTLTTQDGFAACDRQAVVKIQRKVPHKRWRLAALTLSRSDGSFSAHLPDRPGRYRALAKNATLLTGDVCGRARSASVRNPA